MAPLGSPSLSVSLFSPPSSTSRPPPPPSSVLAITASTAMLSLPAPPSASSPTPWLLISSSMSPAATSVRRNQFGPPPALGPGLVHCAVCASIGVQRPPVWIVAPESETRIV